jgi:ribonuclease HI
MSDQAATVHIDGAARGNPGPAAYALVLRRPGEPVIEQAETIGTATNNVAEYTALIRALERAAELGIRTLAVFSDSELIVKQMNGEYRVKNADLQDLYREAQALRKSFERVTLTHVRRAQNADADRLCNEALDRDLDLDLDGRGEKEKRRKGEEMGVRRATAASGAPEALEEEAVALLNAVAVSWAAHGVGTPTAVEVWDRLWALLGEHDALKKTKQ